MEEQVRAAAEHKLGVANQSITAGFFDNNTRLVKHMLKYLMTEKYVSVNLMDTFCSLLSHLFMITVQKIGENTWSPF